MKSPACSVVLHEIYGNFQLWVVRCELVSSVVSHPTCELPVDSCQLLVASWYWRVCQTLYFVRGYWWISTASSFLRVDIGKLTSYWRVSNCHLVSGSWYWSVSIKSTTLDFTIWWWRVPDWQSIFAKFKWWIDLCEGVFASFKLSVDLCKLVLVDVL